MAKQTPEQYAKKILKGRKPIVVNNELMRGLDFDNTRDFFKALGDWGYNMDFGRLPESADTKVQSYLRAFIKDCFID